MVSPLYISNIIVQCFSNIFDLVPTHNETKIFKTRFNLFTVIHSGIPHSVLFSLVLRETLLILDLFPIGYYLYNSQLIQKETDGFTVV